MEPEQTTEQRIDNLNRDADELDRRANAQNADPTRDAEAENMRLAAMRARREAEDLALRP